MEVQAEMKTADVAAAHAGTVEENKERNNKMMMVMKRKRQRPSKRAHTMVLSTDPLNFKAMVQHFTGFSSASASSTSMPSGSVDDSSSSSSSMFFDSLSHHQRHHHRRNPFHESIHFQAPGAPKSAGAVQGNAAAGNSVLYPRGFIQMPWSGFSQGPSPFLRENGHSTPLLRSFDQ
eukprot:TRINITY_DN33270_c0_g1_i1.p1 TRINITY_DN33270_c0_g1~~TRINITY_DN33270_c0_g1_i1.p1  ORF type:complete len:176 (-),score=30.72 TRINITY_DN33270_c0_g1_i1:125-652(-)